MMSQVSGPRSPRMSRFFKVQVLEHSTPDGWVLEQIERFLFLLHQVAWSGGWLCRKDVAWETCGRAHVALYRSQTAGVSGDRESETGNWCLRSKWDPLSAHPALTACPLLVPLSQTDLLLLACPHCAREAHTHCSVQDPPVRKGARYLSV